ncbi:hypothetical protein BJY00DRAFT_200829 [Aspergillus carlsbadensis]|nr:hypothetical protein BJY00DRAFT_200829 [Aspergillus carlsbadensis]
MRCDGEDASNSPPAKPFHAASGKFTYNNTDGLRYDRVARASEDELKREVRRRTRHYTKPWAIAQLSLYGIAHKKSDSVGNIQKIFEDAVKTGQCKAPTAEVQAFEARLAETYDRQLAEHAEAVKDWENKRFAQLSDIADQAHFNTDRFLAKYFLTGGAVGGRPDKTRRREALILDDVAPYDLAEKVRAIPGLVCCQTKYVTLVGWQLSITSAALDSAFDQLASAVTKRYKIDVPREEAEMDLDRFMGKYFWSSHANRNPDRAKTPQPLKFMISPLEDGKLEANLKAGASSTPGLHLEHATGWAGTPSLGGPVNYIVVGWGAEKVRKVVRVLEGEGRKNKAEEKAQEKARQEEVEAEFWRPHTTFMATYRPTSGTLTLGDLKGSYMVKCEKLSEEWEDACRGLRIDIQPQANPLGVVAAFDFGIVSGTMLLSLSEDSLHAFVEEMAAERGSDSDSDSEADSESGFGCYSEGDPKRKRTGGDGNPIPLSDVDWAKLRSRTVYIFDGPAHLSPGTTSTVR